MHRILQHTSLGRPATFAAPSSLRFSTFLVSTLLAKKLEKLEHAKPVHKPVTKIGPQRPAQPQPQQQQQSRPAAPGAKKPVQASSSKQQMQQQKHKQQPAQRQQQQQQPQKKAAAPAQKKKPEMSPEEAMAAQLGIPNMPFGDLNPEDMKKFFEGMGIDSSKLTGGKGGKGSDLGSMYADFERSIAGKSDAQIEQELKKMGVDPNFAGQYSQMEKMERTIRMLQSLDGGDLGELDEDGLMSLLSSEEGQLLLSEMENYQNAIEGKPVDPNSLMASMTQFGQSPEMLTKAFDVQGANMHRDMKKMQSQLKKQGLGSLIDFEVPDEVAAAETQAQSELDQAPKQQMEKPQKQKKSAKKVSNAEFDADLEELDSTWKEFEKEAETVDVSKLQKTQKRARSFEEEIEAEDEDDGDAIPVELSEEEQAAAHRAVLERLNKMDPSLKKNFYAELQSRFGLSDSEIAEMDQSAQSFKSTTTREEDTTLQKLEERIRQEMQQQQQGKPKAGATGPAAAAPKRPQSPTHRAGTTVKSSSSGKPASSGTQKRHYHTSVVAAAAVGAGSGSRGTGSLGNNGGSSSDNGSSLHISAREMQDYADRLKRNLLKSVLRKQKQVQEESDPVRRASSKLTSKKIKHTSSKLSKEEKRREDVLQSQQLAQKERAKQLRRLGLPEKQFLDKGIKLGTSMKDLGLVKKDKKPKKKSEESLNDEEEEDDEESKEEIDAETGLPRYLVKAGSNMRRLLQFTLEYDNRDVRLNEVEVAYVEMSRDYKHAKVKWCIKHGGFLPFEEMQRKNKLLQQAQGFLASRASDHGSLRYVPQLEFFFDIDPRDTTVSVPISAEERAAQLFERMGYNVDRAFEKEELDKDAKLRTFVRYETTERALKRRTRKLAKKLQEKQETAMAKASIAAGGNPEQLDSLREQSKQRSAQISKRRRIRRIMKRRKHTLL